MVARNAGPYESLRLQRPAVGSMRVVYVVSSAIDVVFVVDGVEVEFYVVGVAEGVVRGQELTPIAVVVGDGAIEDGETIWGGVVSAVLGKVYICTQRLSFWHGGPGVDGFQLRGLGQRWRQRWGCLRQLRRWGSQAVTQGKWGQGLVEAAEERHGSNDGSDGNRGRGGGVAYHSGVCFIELLEELVSIDIFSWLPTVMHLGETFPLDKVLNLVAVSPDLEYLLHFPLQLPVDKVWSRFLVFVAI